MSNTCNLEYVMCNGEWSSMIRSRREKRPPLPTVYDDQFYEDLRLFLAHLDEARFLGGEPFLAAETLRIMDLMVDDGLEDPCSLTTNGTPGNARDERILDRLPVSIAVSLDGVTAETVERIRFGADHGVLMANLAHYRAYTLERGTTLDLTFCFMKQNWHEFGDYLRFADEWGCRVFMNTVLAPAFSPYQLSAAAFAEMLATLEGDHERRQRQLGLNLDVWNHELSRLRAWRDRRESTVSVDGPRRAGSDSVLHFKPSPTPERFRVLATDLGVSEEDARRAAQVGLLGA